MKNLLINRIAFICISSAGVVALPSPSMALGPDDYFERTKVVNIPPGLLQEAKVSLGRIRFSGTKSGMYSVSTVFTGTESNEISRSSFTGSMGPNYKFTVRINRQLRLKFSFQGSDAPALPVILNVDALREDGTAIASFPIYDRPQYPHGQEGRYTLAASDSTKGWAVFKVSENGYVTISGRISTGFPFSAGAYLTGDTFNFFSGGKYKFSNYKNPTFDGQIASGVVKLSPTPRADGGGFIDASYRFSDGTKGFKFDTVVSRYTPPPKNTPWFTGLGVDGRIRVVASGGRAAPVETFAILGNLDRTQAAPPLNSLVFQRATVKDFASGTIRGKYTLPLQSKPDSFSGVIFQKTNQAVGYFTGLGLSEPSLTISPASQ